MSKKTIKEWFSKVSDERLKESLLHNMRKSRWDNGNIKTSTLASALKQAFPWNECKTPPGYSSWIKIYNNMSKNQEDYLSNFQNHKKKLKI